MRRVCVALLFSATAGACEPNEPEVRTQWLVTVATDAPVPQLGDRLIVDLLDEQGETACSACRRLLDAPWESWPVSFGVVPGSGVARVRARLYRGALRAGADGLPAGDALIDLVGRLPSPHQKTPVGLLLRTECFRQPSDVSAKTTCLPETAMMGDEPLLGMLEDEVSVGSSPLAERDECRLPPEEGMVCVPGGFFILGAPELSLASTGSLSTPEHLVRISRFALDADEMTVGTVRALVESGRVSGQPKLRAEPSRSIDAACTWLGPSNPSNDALPVNCVSKPFAAAVCRALGKRLPTEAEWEWAAGNLELETRYPWGDSDDLCELAIVGRGRELAIEIDVPDHSSLIEVVSCRLQGDTGVTGWGPVPGGSSTDITELGIRNLGGSMSEFVLDAFAGYDAPCWNAGSVLFDPTCESGANASTRGGSWGGAVDRAGVSVRNPSFERGDLFTGFRCAGSFE